MVNVFQQFNFEDVLRYGVAIVVMLAWLLAILYSIWWGLLLITSGGKEEKVKPAVNHIRHAIIGLVVLIVVLFAAPVLTRILWLQNTELLAPSSIFSAMKELTGYIFGGGSTSLAPASSFDTPSSVGSDFTDL